MTFRLATDILNRIKAALRSKSGHNLLLFAVFLLISAILWCVMSLNEQVTTDVRMPFRITHLPDSVTIVSAEPTTVSVGLQARGTQILKVMWGRTPFFDVDYRIYRQGNAIRLGDTDLKAIARATLDGAAISVVSPDSLNLVFTSQPPVILPVNPDYTATPGPQAALVGIPTLSEDSVRVYTAGRLSSSVEAVTTEPIRLSSLNESVTRRVKLVAPRNSRVVPDSIDITFNVEPLIFKTRKVAVEAINVPGGMKLITFPAQVDVMYMIPVSKYKDSEPYIRVVADYRNIDHNSSRLKVRISDASESLQNVHLASDSADYYIEKL